MAELVDAVVRLSPMGHALLCLAYVLLPLVPVLIWFVLELAQLRSAGHDGDALSEPFAVRACRYGLMLWAAASAVLSVIGGALHGIACLKAWADGAISHIPSAAMAGLILPWIVGGLVIRALVEMRSMAKLSHLTAK